MVRPGTGTVFWARVRVTKGRSHRGKIRFGSDWPTWIIVRITNNRGPRAKIGLHYVGVHGIQLGL